MTDPLRADTSLFLWESVSEGACADDGVLQVTIWSFRVQPDRQGSLIDGLRDHTFEDASGEILEKLVIAKDTFLDQGYGEVSLDLPDRRSADLRERDVPDLEIAGRARVSEKLECAGAARYGLDFAPEAIRERKRERSQDFLLHDVFGEAVNIREIMNVEHEPIAGGPDIPFLHI